MPLLLPYARAERPPPESTWVAVGLAVRFAPGGVDARTAADDALAAALARRLGLRGVRAAASFPAPPPRDAPLPRVAAWLADASALARVASPPSAARRLVEDRPEALVQATTLHLLRGDQVAAARTLAWLRRPGATARGDAAWTRAFVADVMRHLERRVPPRPAALDFELAEARRPWRGW